MNRILHVMLTVGSLEYETACSPTTGGANTAIGRRCKCIISEGMRRN